MPLPSTTVIGPTFGTLRDRKRERTRQTLINVAVDLFERQGYDKTTVAQIAATAEIGARTFFSYFASKEELLFPDVDAKVKAAIDEIGRRQPIDRPIEMLVRALQRATETGSMTGRLAALRMRLIATVPSVRGRALQLQLDAQRDIAAALLRVFPEELTEIGAAALVGAFLGAIVGALQVLLRNPEVLVGESATNPERWAETIRPAILLTLRNLKL
jgi:AcrR family transcriptional regulator